MGYVLCKITKPSLFKLFPNLNKLNWKLIL